MTRWSVTTRMTVPTELNKDDNSHYSGACFLILVRRFNIKLLGPVVQSVISLISSLRVISLTVLADSIYNILIFFAEKM